jgi:DNA-binding transcriptional regulator YiaG
MNANHVREVREKEGWSRAAHARAAGVSDRTIKRAEEGARVSSPIQHRLLNALNKKPDRLQDYVMRDLFPDEEGGTSE